MRTIDKKKWHNIICDNIHNLVIITVGRDKNAFIPLTLQV